VIPPPGACELWVARLPRFAPHQDRLGKLLTHAERAQVDRHRQASDRCRLRLSRALLRLLLARYLEEEPGRIQVDRRCPSCGRPHGKPRLGGRARLHFSVAHAPDLLVFAVQAATPVGVDLEAVAGPGRQPPPELVELALTPAERRHLAQAPPTERWRRFLDYWTRKEAALKQLGTGLATPSTTSGSTWGPGTRLWATGFDLDATHVGAVATAGPAPTLRIADLPVPPLATPAARW
jgi:4'-phosphopantetheinyl transferase